MTVDGSKIVLLGLGPGNPELLTRQAWDLLQGASEIYLRTINHPAVEGFPPHLTVHSFDSIYEQGGSFDLVYEQIVEQVIQLGRRPQGVIYAVPGHPFVAEATSPAIIKRAQEEGIDVQVVDGLSFLEPVFTALQTDPLPGFNIVDAFDIAARHVPTFPPDSAALVVQLHARSVASDVKLTLMELYPDDHPVKLVHSAGLPDELVEQLSLFEVDRSPHIGLLTSLYIPPLGDLTSFESFQEVVAHLRAPDGCPWDREQTHQSLRSYLLEETYEVLAALDEQDASALQEELGDLLLQIVLHAQIASEEGEFNMPGVIQHVNKKLVHRHPHVFGDLTVDGVDNVLANWEILKAAERRQNGKEKNSILDGVPGILPALIQAEQYQSRAARTGFEWPEIQHVWAKIQEEFVEVKNAHNIKDQAAEVGDLLFAVVNLARTLEIDPESALRGANNRFKNRFSYIEDAALKIGKSVSDFSLEQMLAIWQEAKKKESNIDG